MIVRIASSFTAALGRLTNEEQKAAKLAVFDLQADASNPGLKMHRIERSADPDFWSVRASRDLRLVVHRQEGSLMLAYVGHHDEAYRWAAHRRIEVHPTTGAAQLVEVVERVEERVAVASPVPSPVRAAGSFARLTDDQLLGVGVPTYWLQPVRDTPEDELFELLERLPAEAAEALLDYATGGQLARPAPTVASADPFAHPDAERRFRTIDNLDEMKAALDYPWEQWAVFLHPAQRALVTRNWSGPARVAGTAGTGKTIVALHRAVHLALANANAHVLLTTFSPRLARSLAQKLQILASGNPETLKRVTVKPLRQIAYDIHTERLGQPQIASVSQVRAIVLRAAKDVDGLTLSPEFLIDEWTGVIDAWAIDSAEAYAAVPRLGRKTRLGARQRDAAWSVFAAVAAELDRRGLTSWPRVCWRVTQALAARPAGFNHVVVDEAQDLSVAEARLVAALGRGRADALFFAGDLGQRIFELPFSWRALGIDVRGRSQSLKVNYRTSHQIRAAADRLLPAAVADVDGVEEGRRSVVSVFEGPAPTVFLADTVEAERDVVANYLRACLSDGILAGETAVLVRASSQLARARAAVKAAQLSHFDFGDAEQTGNSVAIGIMHDAKGLEFRAVAVMACDEDAIPDPDRLARIGDEADLEEAYATERHLLYVACTRARDRLLVTGVSPGSEFLDDLSMG